MNFYKPLFLLAFIFCSANSKTKAAGNYKLPADSIPVLLMGNFMDDYDISYTITDTLWIQHPDIKYHILRWNTKEQYMVAKNDNKNPSEAGLYSRIDYMLFSNMQPFLWGFCLTVYKATSDLQAESEAQADRENPKKGCNGFPFSRMKKR